MADLGVTRHWRARLKLTFADDPRYDPPTTTSTYSAWIGACGADQARTLLAARVEEIDGVLRWELAEFVEATAGTPEVIAFWEGW